MSGGVTRFNGRLAAWACAILGIAVGQAYAGELQERQVGFNEIVEVRSEEPCLWDARDPLDLVMIQYEVVDHENEGDTDFIAVFQSGSKSATIVIDAWRNGLTIPDKDRFIIRVGGEEEEEEEEEEEVETKYDVGPAMAQLDWPDKAAVAKVFDIEAADLESSRNVQIAIGHIKESLNHLGVKDDPYNSYVGIFERAFREEKVRTVDQHIGAYREVALWLRK